MIVITVQGIPRNLNLDRFSIFLKRMILKNMRTRFLLTKGTVYDDEIHIQFKSDRDGDTVLRTIQYYKFIYKRTTYRLHSYINKDKYLNSVAFNNNELQSLNNNLNMVTRENKCNDKQDIAEVNREIELTRRRRILMEEERKLYLEQKRMEFLKSSTPRNLQELEHVENVCEGASLPTLNVMLAQKKKTQTSNDQLMSVLFKVRMKLLGEMSSILRSNLPRGDTYEITRALHKSLRKRVQCVMKDYACVSYKQIYKMYRARYPKSSDEAYILDLIEDRKKIIVSGNGTLDQTQPVLNSITNRSIDEVSQLFGHVDMNDWMGDDTMKWYVGN